MRVLIAGCGWLGSALGQALVARGDRVVGVRRRAEAAGRLAKLGIEPLVLDLAEPHAVARLPVDVEAIVACQAAGAANLAAYARAYVDATRVLLEHARRRAVGRLVYTGSTGVFDQRRGEEVDETTTPRATRPTARVLLRAERQVLEAGRAGVPACIVRLSGLYGPGRYGIVDRVRSGRLALGPGDDAWMNLCHRTDAVRTLLALLDAGRPGAVYHASDAHPSRRRDVVRWIAGRLGIPPPRQASGAAGEPRPNRRIRAERTRAELALELAYPSFREGLAAATGS